MRCQVLILSTHLQLLKTFSLPKQMMFLADFIDEDRISGW